MSGFSTLSIAGQKSVLVHEALHSVTGLQDDVALANSLGIAGFANLISSTATTADRARASEAIQTFLDKACPKQ